MPAAKKADPDQLYEAIESFAAQDGSAYHKGISRVSGEIVRKNGWEHLFKPVESTHPAVEAATAAPGEKRK
jgi:hypothetical protein